MIYISEFQDCSCVIRCYYLSNVQDLNFTYFFFFCLAAVFSVVCKILTNQSCFNKFTGIYTIVWLFNLHVKCVCHFFQISSVWLFNQKLRRFICRFLKKMNTLWLCPSVHPSIIKTSCACLTLISTCIWNTLMKF